MASRLAAQLEQNASLNTSLLVEKSRRKPTESYLFTGRDADRHDLETIHALGVNGLLQLKALNSSLSTFEGALFSDAVKGVDRTLLNADANEDLDQSIAGFTKLLGPHLMEAPTGKILEWLVRRFRINEFNVEEVLALFLPYHESPHFAKMLTILHIKQQSSWSFLLPFKSASQHIPRVSLVTEMLINPDLARFTTSLLPAAIKQGHTHRTLVAFNAANVHDYIMRCKTLDEGILAFLLPAILEPLQHKSASKDAILGSYILLATLSQKTHLSTKALSAIINSMATCASRVVTKQFVNAVVSVCEPQDELDVLSEKARGAVLRLSGVTDELRGAMIWAGIEKFVCPLISGFGDNLSDEVSCDFIDSIINAKNVPNAIIRRTATILFNHILAAKVDSRNDDIASARRLLSNIQQRHPLVFEKVAKELQETDEVSVEQVVISLSMTFTTEDSSAGYNDIQNAIIGSANASVQVRISALKTLLGSMSTPNFPASVIESIHVALLARIQDRNPDVLAVLFSEPSILIPILAKSPQSYIDYLSQTLACNKPPRALLKTHLKFLGSDFCKQLSVSQVEFEQVFYEVFFPFLLYSKPRQHTAKAAWEIIASEGRDGIGNYELLGGCGDIWKAEINKEWTGSVQHMTNMNMALAARIAENVLVSKGFSRHLDHLLSKLRNPEAHARVLAHLVIRVLICRTSGQHQIDAAHKVLGAMDIENLGVIDKTEGVAEVFGDQNVGSHVVLKPNSRDTTELLQVSILAIFPTIHRPLGVAMDWFVDPGQIMPDMICARFVRIMQAVYKVANKSNRTVSTALLDNLFINLKDDALVFLAGIWTNRAARTTTNDQLCANALRHAAAFLKAYRSFPNPLDFQGVLPSVIVALHTLDQPGREAAMECVDTLFKLSDPHPPAIYGFDSIYGDSSAMLQYLDFADYKRYIAALVSRKDHILQGADNLTVFHQHHFTSSVSDKKDNGYKQRVLCYLLSHVNAVYSLNAKIALMEVLRSLSDQVKAQVLLPTIQGLLQEPTSARSVAGVGLRSEEFSTLIMSCFDASVCSDLNDKASSLWPVFLLSIRHCLSSKSEPSPRQALTHGLERGIFALLTLERKIEICDIVLKVGVQDPDIHSHCKKLLGNLLQDVPVIVRLLASLQPTINDASPRASKRAKLDSVPRDIDSEEMLLRLTLLAEILGSISLPESLELISRLLETLNKVIQYVSPTQVDLSFLQQLLMSAVENAADEVSEVPNLTPSAIRLDILVELIRVADNPQTFQQALLLMASLTRLAPDSVLHNVMPVFTFMGSNVFHRDDSYSFRVVQKTIDSIVPVVVSSLKRTHKGSIGLYIGSRDFLRIFTDAANHIPRHRRSNFFAHLVDVLGPNDFLAPVCMLLVDKVANRVVRQSADDLRSSLTLSVSILQHYSTPVQISIVTEILRESQRLIANALDPENLQPTFLEVLPDEEHALPTSSIYWRRAQALITFVGHAVKLSPAISSTDTVHEGGAIGDLVSLLIDIATVHGDGGSETKVEEIAKAARSSLNRVLCTTLATDFIAAVLAMVESGESRVQAGALELLGDRLQDVADEVRNEIAPTVNKIVDAIQKLIISSSVASVLTSAFRALTAIGVTMSPGEEGPLTNIVPAVLTAIRARKTTASAITALIPLSQKLGPRIIPHFRAIVTECVSVLREGFQDGATTLDDSFTVLQSLLTSIPSFWGDGEIAQIIKLHVEFSSSPGSESMPNLTKLLAKNGPAKVLLPTLCKLWPDISKQIGHFNQFGAFFQLMKRSLRNAPRATMLENLRPLFNVFLESFDVSKVPVAGCLEAETEAISAFLELVVKLNESTFRPLFRRLHDWAFANDTDSTPARKVTFCHIYMSLLDYFKNLMSPYMSFLLQPFMEILGGASSTFSPENYELWSQVIQTLSKSFSLDNGVFWRDDKLRQITPPLIEQVAVCISLNAHNSKATLASCLRNLTDCITDDTLLKSINLNVLMHARSDDARLRIFSLACSEVLWRAHGGKLLGFVPETTTFIAECAEDDNDSVVRQCHKLKQAVESVAGNLNGL